MARRSDLLSGRAATDREAARQGVSSMWKTLASSALCTLVAIAGCVSNDDAIRSNLTPGMVKLSIQKGLTSQAEVMEIFGPPDLVTHRDDLQVWTYDKIRYDVRSSGGYLNVLVAGSNSATLRSSSTSTMLIIYFDSADTVRDYRLSTTRF